MTKLAIYSDAGADHHATVVDPDAIRAELAAIGVAFERWDARHELAADADQAAVLAAYADEVARLTASYGFTSVDVIAIAPDHPQKAAMRDKFRHEHTHADFEVRFFVSGQGVFYLRANDRVYAMLCTRGDLLAVPAGTRHWFDMGEAPALKAIRLFTTPDGWVAAFTGDPIAGRFPSLDALAT